MSFMVGLFNHLTMSAKAYLVPDEPKSHIEVFEKNIFAYSTGHIEESSCIENCFKNIEGSLPPIVYGSLETAMKAIEPHFEAFSKAADKLTEDEIRDLTNAFKKSICNFIEDRWADAAAQSFYSIFSISDRKEQIVLTKKWTHQFFVDLKCLNHCENSCDGLLPEWVANLKLKTANAFSAYSLEIFSQKEALMLMRMSKNPEDFLEALERASEKAAKTPETLSALEKDYLVFAKRITSSDGDSQLKILERCIEHGFALIQDKQSILDSTPSTNFFDKVFREPML